MSSAKHEIEFRQVQDTDLAIFFDQQLDSEANWQAAFTRSDPADKESFDRHWSRIRSSSEVTLRTILAGREVAGYVASYRDPEMPEVTYWVGKLFGGQGIGTGALREFLKTDARRPIYARVAADNLASLRVLEKCGFGVCDRAEAFAEARQESIDEFVSRLDSLLNTSGGSEWTPFP